jgi:phosphoglycolate phosphatase
MLTALRRAGLRLAVATGKPHPYAKKIISHLGLDGCFDAVLGSADFFAGSKIDRAKDYLAKTGGESGKTLVIGDLEHDADMAKELGADCVLLTSGHEHISRLERANVPLIDDLFALIDITK